MPVSSLVAEPQRPDSTEDDEALASKVEKRSTSLVLSVESTGKWKYAALANYAIMYGLLVATVLGDSSGWWHVAIDPAVLATFIGATIGSTIPLYLKFRMGNKAK